MREVESALCFMENFHLTAKHKRRGESNENFSMNAAVSFSTGVRQSKALGRKSNESS